MPHSIVYLQKNIKGSEDIQMQQDGWPWLYYGEENYDATKICKRIKLKKKFEIQRQENLGDSGDEQHSVYGTLQEILE